GKSSYARSAIYPPIETPQSMTFSSCSFSINTRKSFAKTSMEKKPCPDVVNPWPRTSTAIPHTSSVRSWSCGRQLSLLKGKPCKNRMVVLLSVCASLIRYEMLMSPILILFDLIVFSIDKKVVINVIIVSNIRINLSFCSQKSTKMFEKNKKKPDISGSKNPEGFARVTLKCAPSLIG